MSCDRKLKFLALIPSLRAFAFCLTQDRSEADGLVHRSLIEIWSKHALKKNPNLRIAAFTALHEQFRRSAATNLPFMPRIEAKLRPAEQEAFAASFSSLPRSVREAVSLVGVWGFTVEDAAEICGCDSATVERRVAMACAGLITSAPRQNGAVSTKLQEASAVHLAP
jgi:RNA polymerase sigma-70 factor (ECF subfamily)